MSPLSLISLMTPSVFSIHMAEDNILSVSFNLSLFQFNSPPKARYWGDGCSSNKVGLFLAVRAYVRALPSALHNNSQKRQKLMWYYCLC